MVTQSMDTHHELSAAKLVCHFKPASSMVWTQVVLSAGKDCACDVEGSLYAAFAGGMHGVSFCAPML